MFWTIECSKSQLGRHIPITPTVWWMVTERTEARAAAEGRYLGCGCCYGGTIRLSAAANVCVDGENCGLSAHVCQHDLFFRSSFVPAFAPIFWFRFTKILGRDWYWPTKNQDRILQKETHIYVRTPSTIVRCLMSLARDVIVVLHVFLEREKRRDFSFFLHPSMLESEQSEMDIPKKNQGHPRLNLAS